VKRESITKEEKGMGKGSRREICMREEMEYYAGVAGGEVAYDQTGELKQLASRVARVRWSKSTERSRQAWLLGFK
jgi:hypothetical protein